MKRAVKLCVDVPDIFLYDPLVGPLDFWMPTPENALEFEFWEERVEGVISLNLAPQGIDYDAEIDQSGAVLFEYPLACKQIAIVIEGDSHDEMGDKEFLKIVQELTHAYLNRMLSYIRVELGQHWVTPIPVSEWELMYFLREAKAKWLDENGEREVLEGKPFDLMIPPRLDFDGLNLPLDRTKREGIWRFMQEQRGAAPEKELMANAKQYFVNSEYRTAAVEAVTALEVGLFPFVRERCKRRGISYTKFKDLADRFGMSAHLKVLLPLVLSKRELDDWLRTKVDHEPGLSAAARKGDLEGKTIIHDCIQLNDIRNDIVHEGKIPGRQRDIEKIKRGIKAAERLLDCVRGVEK